MNFEEKLADLITEAIEKGVDTDAIISALELQKMALEEKEDD